MRKMLYIGLALLPLAGCAVSTTDTTGARLPSGVTLLESDRNTCAGVVHVETRTVSSSGAVVGRGGEQLA